MGTATYASIVTGMIVAAVILGAGIFPFIDNLSGETVEVSNEGASWIRMAYITDQSDYSAEYSLGDDGITVAGQTGEYGDMILYADSKNTLCIIDDQIVRITGNEYTIYGDDVQTFTVSRTNGVVSFDDYATSESVEWAYVPTEGGAYGSFAPDTLPLNRYNSALAAVGGFAGIYAYNENLTYDAGLVMDADVTDKVINSVKWALPVAEPEETEPLDIDPLDIDPSTWDPIDIDPINPFQPEENQLMAVPTPTYTDGVWGFDLDGSTAKIVSYSGSGGDITVPTTVTTGGNTYNVGFFGKGASNSPVFDNANISDFTLTFPATWGDAVYNSSISTYACVGCTHLKKLTIDITTPKAYFTFANNSFKNCTGLESVVISGTNPISTGTNAFEGCTSLTSYPFDKIQNIQNYCFKGCTALEDVTLNLTANNAYIRGNAFEDCTGLKSVSIVKTNTTSNSVGSYLFNNCTSLESVHIELPSTYSLTTATNMFTNCTSLKEVTLVGWSMLPGSTFYGCTALEEFEIPSSMTNIGAQAFYGCISLGPLFVIPANVTTMGSSVFNGCSSLYYLIVESNVIPSATTFTGSSISQILNFSENEWTVTSYGLNAEEVRSDIEADSYLSVVEISERTTKEGAVFDIVSLIPLALVAGFLLIAVWVFIKK